MEETLKLIKETILNVAKEYNVEIDKIILFGSRARGDYREDSDWDILIVTRERLDKYLFWNLFKKIKRELSKIKVYGDLIIVSSEYYEKNKEDTGNISYYGTVEGKIL